MSQAYFHDDLNPGKPAADRLIVFIFDKEYQDEAASVREGRPIFRLRPYICKMAPGDKNNKVERPLRDEDRLKFPQAWQAYQSKQATPINGTPLDQWPQLNRAQVAELKALNILTVEHLAELPDSYAQRIMGSQELRRKARTFLELSKDAAAFERGKEREAALQAQIDELKAQIAELTTAPAKRIGWPKGKPRGPRKPKDNGHGTDAAATGTDGH